MILLNPKLDYQIDEEVRDKNGRFFGARITLDDVQIVLANIYAPNDTLYSKKSLLAATLIARFHQMTKKVGIPHSKSYRP